MPYRQIVLILFALLATDLVLVAIWKMGHGDPFLFAWPALEQAWKASTSSHVIADSIVIGINVFIVVFLVARALSRQALIVKELAASKRRFGDFAAAAYEWLWEMDSDLRFSYLSDHFQKVTGLSPQSILGRRRDEIAHGGVDSEQWQRHFDDLAHHRPFRNFEYPIADIAGRVSYFSVSGVPVFTADGMFAGYRGTGSVVTERKLAEERLRESQNLLRTIIDTVPAIVNLKDRHARFLLVNRYQARAYGIEPEQMIGHTLEEILGTPQGRLYTASDLGVLSSGQPLLNYEQEWTDRFGLTHVMLVSKVPLTNSSGAPTYLVSVSLDITERRRMEESALRLIAAIETAPEFFVIYDADDRIAVTNQKFRDINRASPGSSAMGLTFEEHIRRIVKAGLVPDAVGREEEWITWRLERHRNPIGPFELRRQQGQILRITEHRLPDGSTVTMSADVTELKRIEVELRAAKDEAELANRTKTEFLANMSHELRTPLNSIIGFTDILVNRRFGRDDPRYDSYLKDVNDAGRDLLRLINDIIDISRIERGQLVLNERNVDVPRLMTACYRLVLGRAHEAQVRIDLALPRESPALHADELRVKQALLNVLANAVKFTPEGGKIDFGAAVQEDGGITFTVKDTGIGIRAEEIPKVMSLFGQADGSLARRYDGAGLGLPMTRSLMELHGGEMTLESTPGVGTAVHLRFPKSRSVRI
ncbi:MAG: PAS domain S-box protein [Rhodospirillales bacterium]|nr:PAS domain S-box protein [Rhodospirillales bacterium]